MDPNRKITKKFTKKFDSKVINRQYFHRKTGLESGDSVKFIEKSDLRFYRTYLSITPRDLDGRCRFPSK